MITVTRAIGKASLKEAVKVNEYVPAIRVLIETFVSRLRGLLRVNMLVSFVDKV